MAEKLGRAVLAVEYVKQCSKCGKSVWEGTAPERCKSCGRARQLWAPMEGTEIVTIKPAAKPTPAEEVKTDG